MARRNVRWQDIRAHVCVTVLDTNVVSAVEPVLNPKAHLAGFGTVNLMAAGERLSPIAFVKRPLLLPAIPPWLRCEIGEASGGKSGGAGR